MGKIAQQFGMTMNNEGEISDEALLAELKGLKALKAAQKPKGLATRVASGIWNAVKDHGWDAAEYMYQGTPFSTIFAVKRLADNWGKDKSEGRSPTGKGGTVEKEFLSGQIPQAGAIVGSLSGPAGAGLGAATGMAVQESIRQGMGLNGPNLPRGTIKETLLTNLQSQAGFAQKMLPEAAKQAALALAGQVVAKKVIAPAAKYIAEKQIATRVLPERIKRLPGLRWLSEGEQAAQKPVMLAAREAHKAQEITRKEAWRAGKDRAVAQVKGMPEEAAGRGRVAAGEHFKESVKKAQDEMGARYESTVKPVVNAYGKAKIKGQGMRQALLNPLQEAGFIDAKGNVMRGEIDKIKTPELKKFYSDMADWVDDLARNPTFRQADMIRRDIQNAAFKQYRSEYARPAHDFRVAMMDSLGEASDPATRRAIAGAREEYTRLKPAMDEMGAIAESSPEEIVSKVGKNAFPLSKAIEVSKTVPALKEPLQGVVLNGLVRSANNPQSFSRTLDNFGREELAQILDPKTWAAVQTYERQLIAAFKPFQGRPFKVPPELDKGLGKFWQKMYNAAQAGSKIDPGAARALFVQFGNQLDRTVRGLNNKNQEREAP